MCNASNLHLKEKFVNIKYVKNFLSGQVKYNDPQMNLVLDMDHCEFHNILGFICADENASSVEVQQ